MKKRAVRARVQPVVMQCSNCNIIMAQMRKDKKAIKKLASALGEAIMIIHSEKDLYRRLQNNIGVVMADRLEKRFHKLLNEYA